MRKDLNVTIHEKYGKEEGTTKAIDKMQEYFKCCGNGVPEDWRYSNYYVSQKIPKHYPESCCIESKRATNCGQTPSNIKKKVNALNSHNYQ